MSLDAPTFSGPASSQGRLSTETPGRLVVIGNFDGVHRGHQEVLRCAHAQAKKDGLVLTVLTFDPHPRQVLSGKVMSVLTTTERKRMLLERLGLDLEVCVLPFTHQIAALDPGAFCEQILVERLNAKVVMVGENFRFAKARAGDLAELRRQGERLGFSAASEELHGDQQGVFSSTRVRSLLDAGDVAAAAQILGRPHLLSGVVVKGDQRGRTLGFPTANLADVPQYLPRDGVYAVRVYDVSSGGAFIAGGALNLGARPTVDRPRSVEVHLLDREIDLYGITLGVELMSPVRAVQKFSDLSELAAQIQKDVAEARRLLATGSAAPDYAPGYEAGGAGQ